MLKNTKTGKQHKTTHSFRYLAAFVALKKKTWRIAMVPGKPQGPVIEAISYTIDGVDVHPLRKYGNIGDIQTYDINVG